jgi:hypothetical protein
MSTYLSLPDDDNWKLFRTIEASPVGTFADDGDWAGGDAFPLTLQTGGIISVPRDHMHATVDLGTILLEAVLTTANRAALVPRGTMTFNLQAIELVPRDCTRSAIHPNLLNLLPDRYIDSAEVTSRPQRKITINGRGIRQMAVRLYGFASVPVTAAELHLSYRLE